MLIAACTFILYLHAAETPVVSTEVNRALLTRLSKTVVSVQAIGKDSGSGVMISPDGLVITSSTLLAEEKGPVQIRFGEGKTLLADVVTSSWVTESALLQIRPGENATTYDYLKLADSTKATIGSRVISAGNPFDSISSDHQISVSIGSVTGIYQVSSCDAASGYCGAAIETDAAINAGSEGGALLNDSGELIGMTCLAVDRTRMKGTAVPINRIKTAYSRQLKALISEGENTLGNVEELPNASVEKALAAFVKISSTDAKVKNVRGIAIDSFGHILTTGIFAEKEQVQIQFPSGEKQDATVLRQSEALDVSLLQLYSHTAANWIGLNEALAVVPGIRMTVVSKGTSSPSITENIVSAVGRLNGTAAQTDARLSECDAGGAVLSAKGDLIGIVSHTSALQQYRSQNAGVSFFTTAAAIQSWCGNSMNAAPRSDDPLAKLVAKTSDAFVFIGDGSGVLISENGYALTNYHVAGDRDTWSVRIGSETRRRMCDVITRDARRDLCLIKVRGLDHAPYLKLGNSAKLVSGQCVLALGDPFKLGEVSGGPAASLGVISALHRYQGRYADAIQTDCSINPGNSGGPLLNLAGELIGINGQIISRYGKNNTGIAFAIPVDQIKMVFESVMTPLVVVTK